MKNAPALGTTLEAAVLAVLSASSLAQPVTVLPSRADPRVASVVYAANAVVRVPVQRGMVTLIVLPDDEAISAPPATGKGADCARETDTWCIAALARDVFVKPKSGATTNNMVIVTNRRRHAFELVVQPEAKPAHALMRLDVTLPPPPASPKLAAAAPPGPAPLSGPELVANRLRAEPVVRNAEYTVAVGNQSEDIVPALVFDNGTHTYLTFPGNRPMPTVFETRADGAEEMVNVRIDSDMLVADRVARRLVLRLGNSVVAVINEAFDADGVPPNKGTLVPGVQRTLRADAAGPVGATR